LTADRGLEPAFRSWVEEILGGEVAWQALAGDGSDKLFFRVRGRDRSLVAVDGSRLEPERQAENLALFKIGRHLAGRGLPVPAIEAARPEKGFFLLEDLGDLLLAQRAPRLGRGARSDLYRAVLKTLLEMQLQGRVGFDPAWCSQTRRYDQEMVLKYESGYFIRSFVGDYCKVSSLPAGLEAELKGLAARAAQAGPVLFLHRDFQSRNILLQGERIRVIDFQAGRLGPPGYDLASLLIDPYVGLEEEERRELFDHYLGLALAQGAVEEEKFRRDYPCLVLHRRFQILGAFAFLSRRKGRPGFEGYLPAVLSSLKSSLDLPPFEDCQSLKSLVAGLRPEDK